MKYYTDFKMQKYYLWSIQAFSWSSSKAREQSRKASPDAFHIKLQTVLDIDGNRTLNQGQLCLIQHRNSQTQFPWFRQNFMFSEVRKRRNGKTRKTMIVFVYVIQTEKECQNEKGFEGRNGEIKKGIKGLWTSLTYSQILLIILLSVFSQQDKKGHFLIR